jgi:hypothetical protein
MNIQINVVSRGLSTRQGCYIANKDASEWEVTSEAGKAGLRMISEQSPINVSTPAIHYFQRSSYSSNTVIRKFDAKSCHARTESR